MTALVQIMAWQRSGNNPLSEAMMVCFANAYMCASLGLNKLKMICQPFMH